MRIKCANVKKILKKTKVYNSKLIKMLEKLSTLEPANSVNVTKNIVVTSQQSIERQSDKKENSAATADSHFSLMMARASTLLWSASNMIALIPNTLTDCTMWKFHDFAIIQILCEIKFEDSRSAKSAILTHLEALIFDVYAFFFTFRWLKS